MPPLLVGWARRSDMVDSAPAEWVHLEIGQCGDGQRRFGEVMLSKPGFVKWLAIYSAETAVGHGPTLHLVKLLLTVRAYEPSTK